MKTKPKKPTLKEVSEKTNYLLYRMDNLQNYASNIIELLGDYIEYKGDSEDFKKRVEEKLKKEEPEEECSTPKTTSKK